MQLTKFTHACIRFDDGDRSLVIDPGAFSEVEAALDGADAVLITHEHADHIDTDKVRAALERDSRLRLWAPASVAKNFAELGEQVTTAEPGQAFDAAGFGVRTFGGQHAVIHPAIPVISNVGYLIGDAVYHPGDSFFVPPVPIEVLFAPLHAPWSKTSEVIDFVVSVRAPKVTGLHDSLLTSTGLNMVRTLVGQFGGQHGSEFVALAPGETIDA
ncbi:MBL fold metallo-hydrolase [uncultured Jatrophihabitans sp.]|uniref:MBL fold metallo-hydrolase n=1 Tax=uncultured Jatrophihabitans sp. TaxID=1610747 RepID=UPI0035CA6D4B